MHELDAQASHTESSCPAKTLTQLLPAISIQVPVLAVVLIVIVAVLILVIVAVKRRRVRDQKDAALRSG